MATEDEYVRKELNRLAASYERLADAFGSLDEKFLPRREYEEARRADALAGQQLAERVEALTSLRDWAIKIVLGVVILALLGLVLVSNGGTPT